MKRLQFIILLLAVKVSLWAQKMNTVEINNVNIINSSTLDFSPTFYKNGIVFISCNAVQGKKKAYDKNINKNAMSLFLSEKDENNQLQKPEPFTLDLMSSFHEGPVSFDKKNDIVFFCRNDSKKATEQGTDRAHYVKGFSHMKIYSSEKKAGNWAQAEELSVNENKTDACHPSISDDGLRLYFASNRPGGYGGMDLYMSEKVYGKWGKPINLGPKINTPKNEVFPFIHESGVLFYSSEDSIGKTGLDIYYSKLDKNGVYEMPQSMGTPFNSDSDDFGFILDANNKSGYMTSNRVGGKGEDDIYTFTTLEALDFLPKKELKPVTNTPTIESDNAQLTIVAIDRKTGNPLSNVSITATPVGQYENNNIKTYITDAQGKVNLPISITNDYILKARNLEYKAEDFSIIKNKIKDEIIILLDNVSEVQASKITQSAPPQYRNVLASKQEDKKAVETINHDMPTIKINKTDAITASSRVVQAVLDTETDIKDDNIYHLSNIYYDFNDFKINPQSALILDTLANILKLNPEMVIEISSHTDCRGTSSFNDMLSKRRAESVVKYLRVKNVNLKQLKSISVGETQPNNECIDYVPCPPEKHQSNRRTEVKILKKARLTNSSKE